MKRTELEELIRETIAEILGEGEAEEKAAKAAELNSINASIKALTAKKAEITKSGAVSEAKDEDDDDAKDEKIKNAQPTKSELKKNASVSKITDALAKVVKDFKATNEEYKKAEGDKKKDLLDKLKDF